MTGPKDCKLFFTINCTFFAHLHLLELPLPRCCSMVDCPLLDRVRVVEGPIDAEVQACLESWCRRQASPFSKLPTNFRRLSLFSKHLQGARAKGNTITGLCPTGVQEKQQVGRSWTGRACAVFVGGATGRPGNATLVALGGSPERRASSGRAALALMGGASFQRAQSTTHGGFAFCLPLLRPAVRQHPPSTCTKRSQPEYRDGRRWQPVLTQW